MAWGGRPLVTSHRRYAADAVQNLLVCVEPLALIVRTTCDRLAHAPLRTPLCTIMPTN
ncbi:hypothetical protein FF011L_04720 [Roseimaritima multifibrata]|uniref:Uncharacterized protein n=1 Tax=Roseimaritima multifibrata TaxID=1930274 RepID=A0A517MAD0_9BACT|nr:hypothetical protein FF011L_04720 [Roseimaritima multifibrata]